MMLCDDVRCPRCDLEFNPYDHEVAYPTAEEIAKTRQIARDTQAANLRALRVSAPEIYRKTRAKWWSERIYRQIGKASAKWAEQEMLKQASPTLALQRFFNV